MGCTSREKHIRASRRSRSLKPEIDPCCFSKPMPESGLQQVICHRGPNDLTKNPNPYQKSNPSFNLEDYNGLGYCNEEQVEEILLKNLDFLYNEAISRLVAIGYHEDVALKAILMNGYCFGGMDVLTNVMHNSLAYLNSKGSGGCSNGNSEESETVFADLRQIQEYSLAGMVCLLQQVRPHMTRSEVLWCLVLSDLHVGRASTMELPSVSSSGNGCTPVSSNVESINNNECAGIMAPTFCRFHGGWGFGNGGNSEFSFNGVFSYNPDMTLQRDIEYPKRFNLSPSMKSLLKRNVAMFAAGFRANSRQAQTQSHGCMNVASGGVGAMVVSGGEVPTEKSEESQNSKSRDGVNSVLSKLRELNIDENLEFVGEDQKDEMIVTLLHQIKDLERQVKERRDWAHEKAMQAARKLSNDLTELKMLRMEKEDNQMLRKGKQTLDESTMKRLAEMESALRKASAQVDRANAAVRRLETENAEIRAEMEASKLSASESVSTCLEVAKREKKCLKRLLAWEKQKSKLQEEIVDEKEKIKELQRCLARVEQDQKEFELKWKQELKAKEQALSEVEEEQRAKEAAEASNKRKLESLRLKIEIDFQRHKDDLQRLEEELSRLKASAESPELNRHSNNSPSADRARSQGDIIARLLHELDRLEDSYEKEVNENRECIICMKDEVSIVFLPCAHQVLCASCNESYGHGKKGRAICPSCRVPIEQRIRIFGASS